ncbi:MAG: hypothetical protein M1834_008868 [Cirrosporium novae-zelandiae]|nr:MAG: hypothetical protein M1834_008868 [Cirrosporium novae-zelandiae]
MALRGERFVIDLSDDEDDHARTQSSSLATGFGLIGEIKEHATSSSPKPPSLSKPQPSGTGFPAHKKRSTASRFKQSRTSNSLSNNNDHPTTQPRKQNGTKNDIRSSKDEPSFEEQQMREIDEENKQRIKNMSQEEIEHERQELMAQLDPDFIRRLLTKATIDDDEKQNKFTHELDDEISGPTGEGDIDQKSSKKVTFADSAIPNAKNISSTGSIALPSSDFSHDLDAHRKPASMSQHPTSDPEAPPTVPPDDLRPVSSPLPPLPPSVHFPHPQQPPELDPSSPSFLDDLHEKYFPDLPTDPSTLSWMRDPTPDETSTYTPDLTTLSPSSIRFSFTGILLAPRTSLSMPTNQGLHNHADAPEAAGYTIPELAHLARSSFPSQRCIAYQTLGRILYRLGKGEWGNEGDALVEGLWRCMTLGRVIDGIMEAARRESGGHRSVHAYAVEAAWLWSQGGGKKWKAA